MVKDSNNPPPGFLCSRDVGTTIAPRVGLTEFTTRGVLPPLPFRRGGRVARDLARYRHRGALAAPETAGGDFRPLPTERASPIGSGREASGTSAMAGAMPLAAAGGSTSRLNWTATARQ